MQNSQENTCVRVSFLTKLQVLACKLIKKLIKSNSGTGVFLWILRNFKEHLFYRTPTDDCFWSQPVETILDVKAAIKKVFSGVSVCTIWKTAMKYIPCVGNLYCKLYLNLKKFSEISKKLFLRAPLLDCFWIEARRQTVK